MRSETMAERIEECRENHLDECAHLLVAAFNTEPWNAKYTPDRAKRELAWTLGVPGFVGLVSVADKVLAFAVGYVVPDDERDIYYLSTLCVSPDVQGTGVGSRLLGQLTERLGAKGVNKIYLTTNRGTPAEAFYGKRGYKTDEKTIVMTHEW